MRMKFVVLFFSIVIFSFGQKKYPKPDKIPSLLFYIQHSLNQNTYVYELNLVNGNLNINNPIKVFRINYEDRGQKENLTLIQRKYAYGVNYLSPDKKKFSLSANKAIPMVLKSDGKNYWIEIEINHKKIILERIFIQSDRHSKGLNPKVEGIIFYGKDIKGNIIQEKFIP